MSVAFYRIVKHLYKIKYLSFRFIPCRVDLPFCHTLFKRGKEALSNRIIMAVATPAHRRYEIMLFHKCQVIRAGILASLVAMNEHLTFWLTLLDRHKQSVDHQMAVDMFIH